MLDLERLPEEFPLHTEAAGTAAPDAFGPFRVLHQVGAGTLGPVFRAFDPEHDRLVAVKLFKLDLPPERVHQLVAAFEQLIAAQLTHPAIAAPLATGIVDNSAYLAHEYVAAESLDLAVREYGPAPASDALRVTAQLAGALDFAAVVNVHHGALHPRDVLLSPDETRLTGLGIARALEQVGATAPVRRPYTPPERAEGAEWDRRGDVFSLAALMHELLWGRRVNGYGGHVADSLVDVPDGDLPALKALFARALAEDPAARFDTALEFAEALKNAFPNVGLPASRKPKHAIPRSVRSAVATARSRSMPPDAADNISTAPPDALSRTNEAPRLPLGDVDALEPADTMCEPAADVDLQLDRETRFAEAESAPAIVPEPAVPDTFDTPSSSRNAAGVARTIDPPFRDLEAPPRRRRMPLLLTLIVGLGAGFAAGYLMRPAAQPTAAPAPAPASTTTPTREFTESTVPPAAAPKQETAAPKTEAAAARLKPEPSVEAGEPANQGRILVRSTPAGATVFVDGREFGRTPVAVRDLARGTHRVRIVRDGYTPVERRVALTASRPAQSLTIPLERARVAGVSTDRVPTPITPGMIGRFAGTLVVESRPTGARVYLDNRLAGTTPLSMTDVDAGEHALRIEHDGYRRWSSMIRIVAAERNRVTASLDR